MKIDLSPFFEYRPSQLLSGLEFGAYCRLPALNFSVLKESTPYEMLCRLLANHSLPDDALGYLEMQNAGAVEAMAYMAEIAPRNVPKLFAKLKTMPFNFEKLTDGQQKVMDALADGTEVMVSEFNANSLASCAKRGWIETEPREVVVEGLPESVKESRAFALALGDAVHKSILEPHLFDSNNWREHWQISPTEGITTKAALRALELNPEKRLLTSNIVDVARQCRDAVHKKKDAAHLIMAPGRKELTGTVYDPDIQVHRKFRLDGCPDDHALGVYDIKTTHKKLHPPSRFRSACYEFGYHQQGAFYIDGLAMCEGKPARESYTLIAVTKEPPFICRTFNLFGAAEDMSMIREGREKYMESMAAFRLAYEESLNLPQERRHEAFGAYEDEDAVLLSTMSMKK